VNQGLYGSDVIFGQALGTTPHTIVIFISAAGQLFCTVACLTSASRMTFAFSRDGAIPGSSVWSKVTKTKVPANAVMLVSVLAGVITLPALIEVNFGTAEVPIILPTAFYAVVSVAVIGLYLSFAIPIFLRWKHGDRFEAGSWNNGSKYKWMNLVAVAEIVIISFYFILPLYPSGWPGNENFEWKFVNYAPILTFGTLGVVTVWWFASARHWFTGPKHTIDEAVVEAFDE
jgi:amino acid transporter